MYATITELAFRSPDALRQATRNLDDLLPEVRRLAGFRALYVLQTDDSAAAMVTLYDSQAALEEGSEQLRPRVAQALGPYVSGAPRRIAGSILLHS